MWRKIQIVLEAYKLSAGFLINNKLRSLLSIIGITIGIFCIIAVLTLSTSLKRNIRSNLETLGLNVVHIDKWPWGIGGGEYRWWDYMSRPHPSHKEYLLFDKRKNLNLIKDIAFSFRIGNAIVKYLKLEKNDAEIFGFSTNYFLMNGFQIESGRFFNEQESKMNKNVVILGSKMAKNLFPNNDGIGKIIKINGKAAIVKGIVKPFGNGLGGPNLDNAIFGTIGFVRLLGNMNSDQADPKITVRGQDDIPVDMVEMECKRIMRSLRMLSPRHQDNFALNKMSLLSETFESTFKIINLVIMIIGSFSLLVGAFGIANIMFVSVKERTSLIGVQKALGAKRWFILHQFLFEAIVLSFIGGLVGMILVFFITILIKQNLDFPIFFSFNIFVTGSIISILVGLIAGLIPSIKASKMNPVEAIRS